MVASVFALAIAWRFVTFTGFSNDHYVHLARAHQMLLGAWPIRDFVDPGMPLMYIVSVVATVLGGEALRSELLVVSVGLAIGATCLAAGASMLARSSAIGAAVAVLAILSTPRSYSYPKILLYGVGGCALLAVAASPTRRRILLLAAVVIVAFLFRHDHGLYLGAAGGVAVLLTSVGDGWAATRDRVMTLVVPVVLVLTPWALYVQWNEGLAAYLSSAIEFSRREAEVTVLRSVPRFAWTPGVAVLNAQNAEAWLYFACYLLPLMALLLAWRRRVARREAWRGESAAVTAMSLLAIVVALGFLRDPLKGRIADAIVPVGFVGAWLLGAAWGGSLRRPARAVAATAMAIVVFSVTAAAIWEVGDDAERLRRIRIFDRPAAFFSFLATQWHEVGLTHAESRFTPSRVSAGLLPFFRYLDRCTGTGDRLFVTGQFPDVFVLAGRGFAGGHVAFMQGFYTSTLEQSRTLARMRQESVPFALVVLDNYPEFAREFPLLSAHLSSRYDRLTDIAIPEMQGVRVLVEHERRASRVDDETGWPCFR